MRLKLDSNGCIFSFISVYQNLKFLLYETEFVFISDFPKGRSKRKTKQKMKYCRNLETSLKMFHFSLIFLQYFSTFVIETFIESCRNVSFFNEMFHYFIWGKYPIDMGDYPHEHGVKSL